MVAAKSLHFAYYSPLLLYPEAVMLPFKNTLLLLMLLGLLTACSSTRLGYDTLPWLISWKSRDYVDLDRAQRKWLRERVVSHRNWHCHQELPAYPALIDQLASPLLAAEPDSTRLLAGRKAFEQAVDRIMSAVAPSLAELLQQLTPVQVEQLQANLADQHQQLHSRYVAPDQATQAAERQQRLEQRLEPWLGRLSPVQQRRIAEWSAQLEGQNAIWLDNRSYWLQAFNKQLQARDQADFASNIQQLLTDRQAFWTPTFRQRTDINTRLAAELLVDLVQLNTPRQNRRLRQRLQHLQQDLQAISCRPGS